MALPGASQRVLLVVPPGYRPDHPAPLVVALHGAGQRATEPVRQFGDAMREAGVILLCPDSSGATWDGIRGDYGPDVRTIDKALSIVFGSHAIDPRRIVLAGFSDGASYILGLGLLNTTLFTKLIACSPGFITSTRPEGPRPPVFISHGHQDRILPFENDRENIVPSVQRFGCKVEFHEFDGGHRVPPEIARMATRFVVA
jgi:predicted esterase